MKEQHYFHIPTPCHEDWNKMDPQQKGRFCTACSKQVIDFTLMSDRQVLDYFKNTTGKVCGRFANDQLERPMAAPAVQKKKSWCLAISLPLLLLAGKAHAQKKGKVAMGAPAMMVQDSVPTILGKVAQVISPVTNQPIKSHQYDAVITRGHINIQGLLTDKTTMTPVSFASVVLKEQPAGTITDANGFFNLSIPDTEILPTLTFSSVGYETKEINLNDSSIRAGITRHKDSDKSLDLNSEMISLSPVILGEIVTLGYAVIRKKPKRSASIKTTIHKILGTEVFTAFPNPAQSGSAVKLTIKKAGNYTIQLLDNAARPVLEKQYNTGKDAFLVELELPPSVVPGMYYLQLFDTTKKKQYTKKIIVQ